MPCKATVAARRKAVGCCWAKGEAAAICSVLGVEQATAWQCICTLWITTPAESASTTVASSSQTGRLGNATSSTAGSRPEHHWARGRSGRSGRPRCWPTDCSEALAGSVLTTARVAIRASRRRELDGCCGPSLRSSPPSVPTPSVPAKELLQVEGGRSLIFAAVWFSGRRRYLPADGSTIRHRRARWCRHKNTAVARRGGFGGVAAGGGRRSGRSR